MGIITGALKVLLRRGTRALDRIALPSCVGLGGQFVSAIVRRRRAARPLSLQALRSVLIIRLDEIGDVVMTTPFLRELRRNLPSAWITLVVKPAVYNLVELCPYVNEVLTFDPRVGGRLPQMRLHARALRFARKFLWGRKFDLAIVPRWDVDFYHASFLAYFSGAAWRIGYSENVSERKKVANRGNDLLYTHVLNDNDLKHEADRNLDLLRFLGGTVEDGQLELWLDPRDNAFAERLLAANDFPPSQLLVALCPSGGRSSLKQWPLERFVEIANWLKERYRAWIVVIGAADERCLGESIQQEAGATVINAAGQTSLRQAAALIKKCNLYIGNDTGLTHIAAAMKIPVVVIFGPTCPHRFSPLGASSVVLRKDLECSPCKRLRHKDRCSHCILPMQRCMAEVSVQEVQESVAHRLQEIGYSGSQTVTTAPGSRKPNLPGG